MPLFWRHFKDKTSTLQSEKQTTKIIDWRLKQLCNSSFVSTGDDGGFLAHGTFVLFAATPDVAVVSPLNPPPFPKAEQKSPLWAVLHSKREKVQNTTVARVVQSTALTDRVEISHALTFYGGAMKGRKLLCHNHQDSIVCDKRIYLYSIYDTSLFTKWTTRVFYCAEQIWAHIIISNIISNLKWLSCLLFFHQIIILIR